MTKWLVRGLVVACVLAAYALGRGVHANASGTTASTGPAYFVCGTSDASNKALVNLLQENCDATKSFSTFSIESIPLRFGYCCIAK